MNINNQTEYKKPFCTRLFILITVCMIVVVMAVPAFAVSLPNPYEPPVPYPTELGGYPFYAVLLDNQNQTVLVASTNPLTVRRAYQADLYPSSLTVPVSWYEWRLYNGSWTKVNSSTANGASISLYSSGSSYDTAQSFLYTNHDIVNTMDSVVFVSPYTPPPPPPDLGQEVTGVLPTVLSWIQQTLNALFVEGGALQGLLLLVAVPVAITLLLLGARFIRSVIWGA